MNSNNCEICGIPAYLKCGNCKNVIYCSKEHQKEHWKKSHKNECKCYELITNATLGRHLIATRNVKQGELILRELPITFGPKVASRPICLGCNKFLTINNEKEDNYYKCSKCHWPMCNQNCEKLKSHLIECELMCGTKINCNINYDSNNLLKKESAYCVIVPLRCLLLKSRKPEEYKKFMNLEHHLDARLSTPIYNVLKVNLLNFIKMIFGTTTFDDQTILKVPAILDTNAFEIRLPKLNNSKIRGIYPLAAMIAHNCVPNTKHVFNNESLEISVIASVDIAKGEIITLSYSQLLQSTLQRRQHLRETKCFDCTCKRCSDSTEFGTFMGGIMCTKCKCYKMQSTDPLNQLAIWKCYSCNYELPAKQIEWGNNDLHKEIEKLPKNSPKSFEEFLIKYSEILHEKNTHVLQIKYALIQLYGNIPGFLLHELTDAGLERKISLCNELLNIASIVEPGYSHLRGNLIFELQEALVVQIKREFENNVITNVEAEKKLMETMEILKEAINILKYEPDWTNLLQTRVKKLTEEIENY